MRNLFVLIIIALLFTSCYPDAKISPAETDTVSTSYVRGTPFSDFKYYQLVDSVMRIDNAGNVDYEEGIYDQLIIERMNKNLQIREYENVTNFPDSTADFHVIISDLSSIQVSYYWSYIPYGSFYWGYDQSNGFYSTPLPNYVTVSANSYYMVDIIEANSVKSSDIPIFWRGIMQGIYTQSMDKRLQDNLDIMFIQSPYLKSLNQ